MEKLIRPLNYKLSLDIDMKYFKYFGEETIAVELKEPADKIVLNSAGLEITRCKITANGDTITPKHSLNKENEELALQFDRKIPAGQHELYISFEGQLLDGLAGFYKSKNITKDGEIKYIATTQFEPADARRCFPCFDEPEMKAVFEISISADKKFEVISNMPALETTDIDKTRKTVRFQPTPKMSTYLVYFGIGEFEYSEDKYRDIAIRFACTKGKKKFGAFAIDCTKKFLEYYETYFGMPYPLPKIDLIALPDFSSGAMENWGAITFREVGLIYDQKNTSVGRKQYIAEVVAHELAHMWFGNLVTMKWWNDLWLNESFATWMAIKVVAHHYPEWEFWNQFLSGDTASAMALDSLKTSHQIDADVKTPHEVNEIFDKISYDKGASLMRMLETFLGEEVFRAGLQKYISTHKYSNTTANDLWSALEDCSKIPVAKIMNSWLKQTGYPIIDVKLEGQKLLLSQKRFLLEPEKEDKSIWAIPLTIVTDSGEEISVLMEEKKKEVKLKQKASWVKLNHGQAGFYRAKYDKKVLDVLKLQVKEKKLGMQDRWGLQHDLWAIAKACEVPASDYLDFIDAYESDSEFIICQDIAGRLAGLYNMAHGTLQESAKKHGLEYCSRLFAGIGWDKKRKEQENTAMLRSQLISALGLFGEHPVLAEGKKRFEAFRKDGALNPDLKGAVYSLVALQGDAKTYEMFTELFEKEEQVEEKLRFLSVLGRFKQKELIKKALDYSLSNAVRSQDLFYVTGRVGANRHAIDLLWPWIKSNFSELKKRFGEGHNVSILGHIIEDLDGLTRLEDEKDIKDFFAKNKVNGIAMKLAQTLETIRINHRFLEKNA
ncbi:MAG: M1 family metallopeptidase [Nanoarchaeota archaeon]